MLVLGLKLVWEADVLLVGAHRRLAEGRLLVRRAAGNGRHARPCLSLPLRLGASR